MLLHFGTLVVALGCAFLGFDQQIKIKLRHSADSELIGESVRKVRRLVSRLDLDKSPGNTVDLRDLPIELDRPEFYVLLWLAHYRLAGTGLWRLLRYRLTRSIHFPLLESISQEHFPWFIASMTLLATAGYASLLISVQFALAWEGSSTYSLTLFAIFSLTALSILVTGALSRYLMFRLERKSSELLRTVSSLIDQFIRRRGPALSRQRVPEER